MKLFYNHPQLKPSNLPLIQRLPFYYQQSMYNEKLILKKQNAYILNKKPPTTSQTVIEIMNKTQIDPILYQFDEDLQKPNKFSELEQPALIQTYNKYDRNSYDIVLNYLKKNKKSVRFPIIKKMSE